MWYGHGHTGRTAAYSPVYTMPLNDMHTFIHPYSIKVKIFGNLILKLS